MVVPGTAALSERPTGGRQPWFGLAAQGCRPEDTGEPRRSDFRGRRRVGRSWDAEPCIRRERGGACVESTQPCGWLEEQSDSARAASVARRVWRSVVVGRLWVVDLRFRRRGS
jgi:hypothetical protein